MSLGIHQRIHSVMREVRGVDKTGHNKQGNYNYAGHEAITEAVRNSFLSHGIVQTYSMTACELLDGGHIQVALDLTWTCHDNPESHITNRLQSIQHCQTQGGKPTAQQTGQAVSYAIKTFTLKAIMLLGSGEDDGDHGPLEVDAVSHPLEVAVFVAEYGEAVTSERLTEINAAVAAWGKENFANHRGARDVIAKAMLEAKSRVRKLGT